MNNYVPEKIEFRKVRDFSQTINDSFTFIKQNFKTMLRPLIYICGFFIVATMATSVLQQLKTIKIVGFAKASTSSGNYPTNFSSYAFGVEYFLLILFSVLTVSAIYLVTYCYIKLYKEQNNTAPNIEQVWGLFKKYIVRFFIATVLLSVLVGIGVLFCIIPGFYLIPLVSLTLPILVMEDKGMMNSFSRSITLIKDNWWRTFGLMIIAGLIAYFSMSILSMPAALLSLGAIFIEDSPNLVLAGSIFSSILTATAQLFYILPAIVSALWYFSLSEEKDGLGLMERIEAFGTNENHSSDDWPKEEY